MYPSKSIMEMTAICQTPKFVLSLINNSGTELCMRLITQVQLFPNDDHLFQFLKIGLSTLMCHASLL